MRYYGTANKTVGWAVTLGLCCTFWMRTCPCPHYSLLRNLCCHLEARSMTLSAQVTFIRGPRDRVGADYRSRAVMWCSVIFQTVKNRRGGFRNGNLNSNQLYRVWVLFGRWVLLWLQKAERQNGWLHWWAGTRSWGPLSWKVGGFLLFSVPMVSVFLLKRYSTRTKWPHVT